MAKFKVQLSDLCAINYDDSWECGVCQAHYCFTFTDSQVVCVMCEFKRMNRDKMTVQGWNIFKTANQVVCSRIS